MATIDETKKRTLSRRTFIKAAGCAAAASFLPGIARTAAAGPCRHRICRPAAGNHRTRLVLLGTSGGVSWWPGTDRASTSTALVVGDAFYVIDLGQGTASRLAEAFNWGTFIRSPGGRIEDGSSIFLQDMKALFFTHLHQDHIADYPSLLLIGPGAGLGTVTDPDTKEARIAPLKVIGPCNRGALEIDKTGFVARGGAIVPTGTYLPYDRRQTPGTREMTDLIWQAFGQTINDMTLDNGYPDFTRLVDVGDIGGNEPQDIPWPAGCDLPDLASSETCVAMDPFEIYRDDDVIVSAVLVDHHQVFPAFAFRFDTGDGSVVISGDTGRETQGNLQLLADGADILVHEVIDPAWIEQKFKGAEDGSPMDALKKHMYASHTTIEDAGRVATECGARTLVLNHIVPGNTPRAHLLQARRTFSGKLIIGEDLMEMGVGKPKRRK